MRRWTPEELELLMAGYGDGDGVPVVELAATLGRKPIHVTQKARRLGLLHPASHQNRKLTDADVELLRSGWSSGASTRELAERLGRKETSVQAWVKQFRFRRSAGNLSIPTHDAFVKLSRDAISALDEWRGAMEPVPDRSSAIVALVEMASRQRTEQPT